MSERRSSRDRPLDQRGPRVDVCPACGGERQELLVVPDRFYCEACKVASEGPNTALPVEPEIQLTLGVPSADAADDRPPLDESQAAATDRADDEAPALP